MNIAIIPARGNSKRLPRKNIKKFFKKPIISYSIKYALDSGLFDEVMVSTDDIEIAEISKKYGAKVPFMRSDETSNDFATTVDVINEVIRDYYIKENKTFEYGCCIYSTAPLIRIEDIKMGLSEMIYHDYDSVFPVVEFEYPIWRGVEIDERNKVNMIWPDNKNKRSQDLKKVYHDAGQWYWFNVSRIKNDLFTEKSGSIILPKENVQDVDDYSDWKLLELKYKLKL